MKSLAAFDSYAIPAVVAVCVFSLVTLFGCGGRSQPPTPPLMIMTASLPNGTAGTPYGQTIQASGGVAPFSWTLSAGGLPHSLLLGNSTTNKVTIIGTPDTVVQALVFTIKITDSASQSASQAYTVSIVPEPDTLTLTPSSLSFAPQLIGAKSNAQTETVANTGTSQVEISSIALSGTNAADFNQSGTCGSSLAAGANCGLNVTFVPSQLGPRGAAITITDTTVGSPHSVALSGVGLTPGPNATLAATSLTFGSQAVGTTSPAQSITLSNYGTSTLNVATITATTNFGETDDCTTNLASGASCTVNVTFTPNVTGTINGTLSITDNAPGSPQDVVLSGTGSSGGRCVPKGGQCYQGHSCCPGLQCVPASTRAFCE
jgi:hypothetical protein